MKNSKLQRQKRHKRARNKILSSDRFRLAVFRSNKHIYCQLIDDKKSVTVAAASDAKISGNKQEKAKATGAAIAKISTEKKIKEVIFDRAGYKYHGRVRALAEGAREGGLIF